MAPRPDGCHKALLAVLALAGLLAAGAGAAQEPPPTAAPPPRPAAPRLLVLASYHRGFAWTDRQTDGALAALRARWPELDPVVEHLDSQRAVGPAAAERAREVLHHLEGQRFDGVITSDDAALDLALEHRSDLLAGAAISFSGVNRLDPRRLEGLTRVTGVTEDVDVAGTLRLMRVLQPDLRSVVVVLDRSETSAGIEARVHQAAAAIGPSLGVRVEADRTLAELEGLVTGLDRRSALLLGSFIVDRLGKYHGAEVVAERLSARSGAPCYGLWDFQLGHGIVGGSLIGGEAQGRRAAELLLALLDGAPAPIESGPTFLALDAEVAHRLGLSIEGRLGLDGARVLHRPEGLLEGHGGLVLGGLAVLGALLLLSAGLLELVRRMRRTEQRVRDSEERYRSIVDAVDDAIFIHDAATLAILDVNQRACEMYRMARETLLRDGLGAISAGTPPFTGEEAARWLTRAVQEGPQRFEWRARRSDGTLFWAEVAVRPARIGGRELLAVAVRDLTGVREAARALQESERRFRDLTNLLPQVVYETDATGRITFVNRRAYEAFGYGPGEVARGLELRQLVVPEQREAVVANQGRVMAGGPIAGQEALALRKDGSTFPVLIYSAAALVEGRAVGLRGLLIDVGDRKRSEEERAAMQRRIEEGQRLESIGRLAGGVAHDFNNLLTPILGNAQGALEAVGGDHPAADGLRAIVAAAERAGALTRQLLAFSRRQVLDDRPVDLNAEVAAIHAMLRRVIGEDVVVRLDLAPTLGRLRGDPTQIQQVLLNLAANAREAMPGGGQLTISTRDLPAAEAPPTPGGAVRDLVELCVSDSGIGMSEEVRSHIFEPFFATRGLGQGAGLGLATVLGVVQQHGGDVEVRSAPGKGTTFRLLFPRDDQALPEQREPTLATTPAFGTPAPPRVPSAAGRTVLLAEDEPVVRRLLEGYLRAAGFAVLAALDGQEAVEVARRHPGRVDLLVSDVVMPGMNGRELQQAVAALHPDVRVLFISGYPALPGSQEELVDGTREAFLAKPFTRGELMARIAAVLERPPGGDRRAPAGR